MQIYENPFKEAGNAVQKQATSGILSAKVRALFDHQPHSEQHRHSNTAATILSFICNILSGLTSGAVIGFVTYKALAPIHHLFALCAAFLIAVALVVVIESIKRHSLKQSLRNALQYKSYSPGLLLLALAFCSISVLSSYFGARLIPQQMAEPPQLTNLDSLQAKYDNEIKAATILHTYKPTNTLTRKGAAIVGDLREEKRTAIQTARDDNKQVIEAHTEATSYDIRLLSGIALAVELLFILCLWWSMSYYWRCFVEMQSDGEQQPPQVRNIETPTNTKGEPRPAPQNRIGFFTNENRTNENRKGTRECKNCGEWYIHKHHKQKYCCTACRVEYWQNAQTRN